MLSKEFLLERGYCCGHGCFMCPYTPRHMENNTMSYNPLPEGLTIKKSPISGLGLFALKSIALNHNLGITHITNTLAGYHFDNDVIRTPLGGFINHSEEPNARIDKRDNLWYLITTDVIVSNTEIAVKYFPEFIKF